MKFRRATKNDVSIIVEMLAVDELGINSEKFQIPLSVEYFNAFAGGNFKTYPVIQ